MAVCQAEMVIEESGRDCKTASRRSPRAASLRRGGVMVSGTDADAGLTAALSAINPAALLAFTQDLVRCRSDGARDGAAARLVAAEMDRLGFHHVEVDRHGNAVGLIGDPESGPTVLADGHIDTIPPHTLDSWTHDPFSATVAGGRLYGLGTADMKSSVAALVHGAAALAASGAPRRGAVICVASIAEEMMEGATLARTVADLGFRPDFGLIVEPTDLRLATAQRGRAKVEVTLRGRAVHAAYPQEGVNALAGMARLIAHAGTLEHPSHPLLGSRTLTPIDAESRPLPSVSVVPGWCRAHFDCRFLPGETPEGVLDLLRNPLKLWGWLASDDADRVVRDRPVATVRIAPATFSTWTGDEYVVPEVAPCWETPHDHPLATRALAGMAAAGLAAETTVYQFCTNGSLLAGTLGIPTVGLGVGLQEHAHTVDESVVVDDLLRGARGYIGLLSRVLEGG